MDYDETLQCENSIPTLKFWERDLYFETTPSSVSKNLGTLSGKKILEEIYARLNRSNISRNFFDQSIRKTGIVLEDIFRDIGPADQRRRLQGRTSNNLVLRNKIEPIEPIEESRSRPSLRSHKGGAHHKKDSLTRKDVGIDYSNENKIEPWPKVRHRSIKKPKAILRSTRMTPMHLMQNDDFEQLKDEGKKSKEEEEEMQLSPYSVKKQLNQLTRKFPNVNLTIEVIGRTVEYNDIVLLKAAQTKSSRMFRSGREDKYVDDEPEKKIVFIVHGLTVMGYKSMPCFTREKSFEQLLSYYFAHLDKFDFFIIPMANPDGAAAREQMWNKNMSPQSGCPGVALDRNFDVAWNSSTNINSCSQQFPGVYPFSELETQAVKKVLHQYGHKITAYIHVHSGTYSIDDFKGDAVLYPKGYTEHQIDDDKYIDLRGEIDEAMKNASFRVMSVLVDTIHHWYGGPVTGTSVDYAASVFGIPYSLEFVMQIYSDLSAIYDFNLIALGETVSNAALEEIWKRVIDVTLNNISKFLSKGE